MACDKWEISGLLFVSEELDAQEIKEFQRHMQTCAECQQEYNMYQKERKEFFTLDILGAAPSPALDAEIKKLCSKGTRPAFLFPFATAFVRKAVFPVLFFGLGMGSGVYYALNYGNSSANNNAIVQQNTPAQSISPSNGISVSNESSVQTAQNTDSLNDSINGYRDAKPFSQTQGGGGGVIPVDVK